LELFKDIGCFGELSPLDAWIERVVGGRLRL
jgi:hypothetical protein